CGDGNVQGIFCAGRLRPRPSSLSERQAYARCDTLSRNGGNMRRNTLILFMAAVAAFTLTAQEKKDDMKMTPKAPAKSAILHPEMTVESGTYAKPMATIGTKPDQPWTTTTVAAGVDSKPQMGKVITRVGEIVDFSCYL